MHALFLLQAAAADWAPQPEHAALLAAAESDLIRYDLDGAVEKLDQLLADDPDCGAARWRLGQVLVHSRRPEQAVAVLTALQAEHPTRLEPPLALAWAGLSVSDPDAVDVAATMANTLAPEDPEPVLLLAWSDVVSGDLAAGQARLDALSEVPEAACVSARLAWAQEDYVESAVALARCERVAPLLLVRDTRSALSALQAPEDDRSDGPSELDMQLHVGARDLLMADRPEDAVALLELLLRRYPRDLNARIWMGRGYEMLGAPERAVVLYDEVLHADWRSLYLDGRAEGVLAWTGEEGVRAGIANVARRQALLLHDSGRHGMAWAVLRDAETDVGSWPALTLAAQELADREK